MNLNYLITFLGIIPFYFHFIPISLISLEENFSIYYGLAISLFLNGMQWQRVLGEKFNLFKKIIPVVPILLLILINFFISLDSTKWIVIFFLLTSLFIDCILHKELISKNFCKVRIISTFFATFSFFI